MSHKRSAFTLIEVLLSLFITAILITILAVVFNTGLRAYRQGKDLIEITRKGQIILGQMTKELSASMIGPNITFVGAANSVYFMAPADNNSNLDLCELGYSVDNNTHELNRHYVTYGAQGFEYPANVVYSTGNNFTLCDRVTVFNLRYYDPNSTPNWGSTWSDAAHISKLPTMVEVSVTIQGRYPASAPAQTKIFTTWIYLPNSTNN